MKNYPIVTIRRKHNFEISTKRMCTLTKHHRIKYKKNKTNTFIKLNNEPSRTKTLGQQLN